jgi:hypothetical protein
VVELIQCRVLEHLRAALFFTGVALEIVAESFVFI